MHKITIVWNSNRMAWEDVTASLSALMEYENTPTTEITFIVKGKPTLEALQQMVEAAKASGVEGNLKVVATFDSSKQLRLFGPEATETLATVTEIDDFLKGNQSEPEY